MSPRLIALMTGPWRNELGAVYCPCGTLIATGNSARSCLVCRTTVV